MATCKACVAEINTLHIDIICSVDITFGTKFHTIHSLIIDNSNVFNFKQAEDTKCHLNFVKVS